MTPSIAYLLLVSVAAIWGASWMAGRVISLHQVDPLIAASGRFLFGVAGLLVVLAAKGPFVPLGTLRPRQWMGLVGMGFCGVYFYNVCFFHGLQTVPSSRASLLVALQPSVVMLFSWAVLRERVAMRQWGGLLLSLTGVSMVMVQGDLQRVMAQGLGSGDVWLLGCVVSWSAYTLLGRVVLRDLAALPATTYSTSIGLAALLATAWLQGASPNFAQWDTQVWIGVAFLGLAGTTLAFLGYLSAVAAVGAPKATIFLNLTPLFGVLFSVLFLHERLTVWTTGGGCLAILGVWLLISAKAKVLK